MAACDIMDTNYWKMHEATKDDSSSCFQKADNLAKEYMDDGKRDLASGLICAAYHDRLDRLRKDVPKVTLLNPDFRLTDEDAVRLLALVLRLTGGYFKDRCWSLIDDVERKRKEMSCE